MKQETPKQHVELINDNIEEFDKSIELFKQETTLEEVIERLFIHYPESSGYKKAALIGKEWQQKRSYSEEDMLQSFLAGIKCESKNGKNFEQFIKQFKNK